MKKLDHIPKKQFFTVPDGYFDALPTRIQEKINGNIERASFFYRYRLQYALPVVLVVLVGTLWLGNRQPRDAEAILATIATEQLVAYLTESEMTTEELIETAGLDALDLESIESEIYPMELETEAIEDIFGDETDYDNIID